MSNRRRKPNRTKMQVSQRDGSSSAVPADPQEAAAPPAGRSIDKALAAADGAQAQIQVAHSVSVSGPLPHPEFFQSYERTLPGAADRILTMAEKQQHHRHSQQTSRLTLDAARERRGQWMGFLVAVSGVIGGVTLIMFDKPVAGFTTLLGAIGSIVGSFLWARRRTRETPAPDSPQAPSQKARVPAPPD